MIISFDADNVYSFLKTLPFDSAQRNAWGQPRPTLNVNLSSLTLSDPDFDSDELAGALYWLHATVQQI